MKTISSSPANPVGGGIPDHNKGLTKREYFAGLAFQATLYADETYKARLEPEQIARMSVKLADELIKALNEIPE